MTMTQKQTDRITEEFSDIIFICTKQLTSLMYDADTEINISIRVNPKEIYFGITLLDNNMVPISETILLEMKQIWASHNPQNNVQMIYIIFNELNIGFMEQDLIDRVIEPKEFIHLPMFKKIYRMLSA